MKKLFSIISISLIALLFVISCSNQTPTPGTSPETKKQMTQSEYASNKAAINALNVVEAYGMNVATPSARSLSTSKEYKFDKEVDINTTALKEKLNSIEDPILKQMISNLPNDFTVKIKQGSYFSYTISEEGIFTYHTIDLLININGKEIEIEKDYDDNWIEIDGTFFDSTPLEEMLELADDAADVIEDLFNKFKWTSIELGKENKFDLDILDDNNKKVEANISGSITVSYTDKDFLMIFDLNCIEYDDGKEDGKFSLYVKLTFNALLESFGKDTTIEQLLEKLDDSIIVKVNGKDIWKEAFLQELD